MSIVDKIAAATGLNQVMNRQQVKQAGLDKEPVTEPKSFRPLNSDDRTPVVVKDPALAGRILSHAVEAIDKASAHLGQAMDIAREAATAPLSTQASMTAKFNTQLHYAQESLAKAKSENNFSLVGTQSKPMMAVGEEGGQVHVADAGTAGLDALSKATWLDQQAILASATQLETAMISLAASRSQFSSAQYTLSIAAELNRGKVVNDYRARAGMASATIDGAANAAWQAEAKRTVVNEADREASVRAAFAREMSKE